MRLVRSSIVILLLAAFLAAGCAGAEPGGGGTEVTQTTAQAAPATVTTTPGGGSPSPTTAAPSTQEVWPDSPRNKTRLPATQPVLVAVRTGHHTTKDITYDRVTFEFSGPLPGYRIRYVPQVIQDGSGAPVALEGQAFLQVALDPSSAHTQSGARSYPQPPSIITGLPSLKHVRLAGDFEGVVSFGLGLDDHVGFRVLELTGPSRIVVDVPA